MRPEFFDSGVCLSGAVRSVRRIPSEGFFLEKVWGAVILKFEIVTIFCATVNEKLTDFLLEVVQYFLFVR